MIEQMTEPNHLHYVSATLVKRLLAMLYDSLLLIAVLFLAMAVFLLLAGGESPRPGNPIMTIYLLLVCFLFFGWFWTHGGQTLGMRAWKLTLQQSDGQPVSWLQAALRIVTATPAWIVFMTGIALSAGIPLQSYSWLQTLEQVPGGLVLVIGVVWLTIDQWPGGWRDKLTRTRVIQQTKQKT